MHPNLSRVLRPSRLWPPALRLIRLCRLLDGRASSDVTSCIVPGQLLSSRPSSQPGEFQVCFADRGRSQCGCGHSLRASGAAGEDQRWKCLLFFAGQVQVDDQRERDPRSMMAIVCEETCPPQSRAWADAGAQDSRPKLRHIVCLPTFIIIIGQGERFFASLQEVCLNLCPKGVFGTAPWFAFSYLTMWLELNCFPHSQAREPPRVTAVTLRPSGQGCGHHCLLQHRRGPLWDCGRQSNAALLQAEPRVRRPVLQVCFWTSLRGASRITVHQDASELMLFKVVGKTRCCSEELHKWQSSSPCRSSPRSCLASAPLLKIFRHRFERSFSCMVVSIEAAWTTRALVPP